MLTNVYIHINIVIIRKKNNQKCEGKSLVINLLVLQLESLCVFFEHDYKIIKTFEW